MPMFLRLTMPAVGTMPERPIAVAVQHIISVTPRYVVHPDDKMRVRDEKRMLLDGTWVETTANVGSEESSTFHVTEAFETVMGGIPEGEVWS